MPPESGGICGRLTSDLPLGYLQGGKWEGHTGALPALHQFNWSHQFGSILSSASDFLVSPIWRDQGFSCSEVDGFVPHTLPVNLRTASQHDCIPSPTQFGLPIIGFKAESPQKNILPATSKFIE